MKKKSFILVYTCAVLLFVFLCVLSVYEVVRSNSLAEQLKDVKGSPSQISQLQSQLESQRKENSDLSSRLGDLKNKYDTLEGQYKTQQSQIDTMQSTRKSHGKGGRVAYLTFDDGPSRLTGQLLDTLKASQVNATFFVVGTNAQDYPDILKRAASEGNVIGIHSWTHNYSYIYKNTDNFFEDFNRLDGYLTQLLGTQSTVCRYPGGTNNTVSFHYNPNHIMRDIDYAVKAKGFKPYDWNVDADDAKIPVPSKDAIVRTVVSEASQQKVAVILFHDSGTHTTTIEAVPEVIRSLRGMGFTFGTLSSSTPSVQFAPV